MPNANIILPGRWDVAVADNTGDDWPIDGSKKREKILSIYHNTKFLKPLSLKGQVVGSKSVNLILGEIA